MSKDTKLFLDGADSVVERTIQRSDKILGNRLPPGFVFFIVIPLALCTVIAWLRG